jgi:hypothetical protein
MADFKDQTICIKFCFNLEKTASETWQQKKIFELYLSLRSGQNLVEDSECSHCPRSIRKCRMRRKTPYTV